MPPPLLWNTPAFRWNAPGVLWNGTEPTKKRPMTMPNLKAIIDFSGYVAAELAPAAQMIHDSMAAAAASFPAPPTAMPAFQLTITDYQAKLAARASNATSDTIAFTVARHELETELSGLGNYVNTVADGDPTLVNASGIPSYPTTRVPDTNPPAAPTNVRLRQGDLSGSVVGRATIARSNSMNQWQKNLGDPNAEASWVEAGMFSGGKAVLSGFTPGTTVWFRLRTAGIKGVMGAWSDPAKIMVV